MDHKYEMLMKILDRLRKEAPSSYKTYLPGIQDKEKLGKAYSLTFIHLLLKVKFGLTDFLTRHQLITDGPQDGGLDAYYIDEERKRLFLIQSKFRLSADNFASKSMKAEDIIKMEVARITKGEKTDSNGINFNNKIFAFQERLKDIRDIAKYDYIVLFLGNIYKLNDEQIRRLIDNCNYEIYDAAEAYEKLIFPLATGTYYDPDEIIIKLELKHKESPRLKQLIETDFGQFNVTCIFVPTHEVGRVLARYKNAILKYNPRNFLSLQKKSVNDNIRRSIIDQKKNNFAILNNGITLLSDNVNISESTGRQNEGQLILTRPQILNGGQTAYTLSTIFENFQDKSENPLKEKEVLLKIVTPISEEDSVDAQFIELISNATNQQNEVSEADRRSNHDIQISIQNNIYRKYGYFYERKSGEFHDGINDGLIDKSIVINRLSFIKAYWAYLGEPAAARRTSEKLLFREDNFYRILKDTTKYHEMFFSYLVYHHMEEIEREFSNKTDTIDQFGYSLLYGKWAVIASLGITKQSFTHDPEEIQNRSKELAMNRIFGWHHFDSFVKHKRRDTKYFKDGRANYELYYKVNMLDEDIHEYFLR